jgi:hypothetical protein
MPSSTPTPTPNDVADQAALLNSLGGLAAEALTRGMAELFVSLQRVMVELAGSTPVVSEQQRFLDALREMARSQETIRSDFLARLGAGFERIITPPETAATAPGFSADSLELVSQEQIERHVLSAGMANRARDRAQKALFQLHERMLRIAAVPFEEADNPLDPANITRAFLEASSMLGPDPRILRPLCSQFDSCVLSCLGELYSAANDLLREAGVLPELSPLTRGSRKPDARSRPADQGPEAAAPAAAESSRAASDLRDISELLARLRTVAPALPASVVSTATAAVPASVSTAGLANLVAELQGSATWLDAGNAPLPDIREALAAIARQTGRLSLAATDHDTIGLVTLFFDTVNADRNLPLEIQAMIARLQLPVLRLALQDRSFFADAAHPARQLIDLMARAGLGWDPENAEVQTVLLAQLRGVVDEVLTGENDQACYRAAASRLQEHATRTEQRALKMERRTAERAEADARTNAARDAVYQALRERIDGISLPAPVLDFLNSDWQRVMQLFHLRRGIASAEWQDAVQVIDDLVASVRNRPQRSERADFEARMEQLHARLENALGQTQSHTADAEARVDVIRNLHRDTLSDTESPAPPAPMVPAQVTLPAPIPPRGALRPDPLAGGRPIGEVLMFESLQKADAVPVGSWLEYKDPRSGVTRRCKLSARIEESRTLIFSDRSGATIWEKSRKLFAYELQIGFLQQIEDTSLVERTLGRMAENLRSSANATS